MSINIDSAIFIGFLIATVMLGLFSSYGINNIRQYAIGERNFSTASIVATIVATWASGQAFFTILAETYTSGLYFLWSVLGYILCLLSIGMFFAPRMGEFLGKLSIAEAMYSLYGREVRIITAISGFIASGGMIALQLKVSGFLFEYCFGIPEIYGVIIGGAIVTLYSSLGGIKSVTFTDIIQLFTFSAMIPALALFILGTLDNSEGIITTLTNNEIFDYKKVFDFSQSKSIYFIFLFLFNAIPAFNPAFFQRIVMAKDTTQVGRSFIISAFTCLVIILTIAFIAILILSTKPGLNANDITKHILFNYSYPGLKGFILAGIMAMVLSTADSYINSTAILFVNDFCKPLRIQIIKDELLFSRLASAILGITSIFLALRSGSLLELIIAANMFYMPIVTVPFILAVLGFRTSGKAVLIGMAAGFIGVILWENYFKVGNIDGLVPGMVSNLVFLLGAHYFLRQPGGWVGIKDKQPIKKIKKSRAIKIRNFIGAISNFSLTNLLRQNSPTSETIYVYFGLFCIISFISLHFKVVYLLLLLGSILIIFFKPKQEYQKLTEEKNEYLNDRLGVQDKELQEALAIKAEFLRNIPHEYHAAMTGVVSTSETLRDGYDKLSDKHRKMAIDNIFTSSISLKSFDDNITTLARLSKPDYELHKEDIDFSTLVYDRVQTCRKYYEENTEDREFDLNIKDGVIVNGDKHYMIHLLDNLVINAIKYCKKGKISIVLKKSKESVDFIVSDEGIGIPKTELYDVFEPFTVSSKTRTQAGGRGIGLTICKRIVEAHGGSITADSDGECGAELRFTLPI
jgi:Na+/proline symporter/two-component sensor histidine kinase/uncharacterized membrane-anchored protein YhcB (DUF1043 family)